MGWEFDSKQSVEFTIESETDLKDAMEMLASDEVICDVDSHIHVDRAYARPVIKVRSSIFCNPQAFYEWIDGIEEALEDYGVMFKRAVYVLERKPVVDGQPLDEPSEEAMPTDGLLLLAAPVPDEKDENNSFTS